MPETKSIPLAAIVSKPFISYQYSLIDKVPLKKDVVFTPEDVAIDIIKHFKPKGKLLDPCRGDGAFYNNLPEPKDYCELTEGKDFYEYTDKVDWIISNPPFTKFSNWLKHSLIVADNIVYLIPMQKVFYTYSMIKKLYEWGGVKEIWMIGTGSSLGFPFGAGVAAIYFKRGYREGINVTFR